MATATLSDEEIRERIKTGKHMLFFTADWCPDCAFIKPVMPQYDWITVDRDANIEIAQDMGVMGIPSFVGIEDGQEIGRYVDKFRKTQKQVEDFLDTLEK